MAADKIAILQQVLEPGAHLFASLGAAIAFEDGPAISNELVEFISHRNHS
jgi:hypothetical protein